MEPYVLTEAGLDRSLYEMAALIELRNSPRSGDVWVPGSRQFKDFEDYLLPQERFATMAATRSTVDFNSLKEGILIWL